MPKLTPKELEIRRKKLQDEALDSVAARGQFNFRLDGTDIKRLYELAGNRQKPVSAMVREWVIERLAAEEANTTAAPVWAQLLQEHLLTTEACVITMALSGAQNMEIDPRTRLDLIRKKLSSKQSSDIESLFSSFDNLPTTTAEVKLTHPDNSL